MLRSEGIELLVTALACADNDTVANAAGALMHCADNCMLHAAMLTGLTLCVFPCDSGSSDCDSTVWRYPGSYFCPEQVTR